MNRWITSEAFHIIFICFNTLEGVIFTKSYTKTNKKIFISKPAFGMININIMICTFFAFFFFLHSIILFFRGFLLYSPADIMRCDDSILCVFYDRILRSTTKSHNIVLILSLHIYTIWKERVVKNEMKRKKGRYII